MQKMRNLRVYYSGVLALTLVATLLRSLALTLAFNRADGYFKTGAGLPVALTALLAVGATAILLFPLLLRNCIPTTDSKKSPLKHASSVLCALLFLISFISTCIAKKTIALPAFLWLVSILSLLAATVYFLTKTPICPLDTTGTAIFGSLSLVACACLITVTYFDVATPMNAPVKVHLHLALLSVILYLLYELRDTVGAPLPRMRTVFTGLAFFFCITVGASDLVAALAGYTKGFIYLSHDLLLLGLGFYVAVRGTADLNALSHTERMTATK